MSPTISSFWLGNLKNSNHIHRSYFNYYVIFNVLYRKLTHNTGKLYFYSSPSCNNEQKEKKKFLNSDGNFEEKIIPKTIKISLIDINGEKTTTYLEQAQKIAKHNRFKLVKVADDTIKPTYKLAKYEIDVKSSSTGNSKKVVFGSNILPHDIAYKVKHVCKMVAKGKVVDVTIERKKDQANTYESILKLIQEKLEVDHKLTKRSEKSSVIGFTIRPKVMKTRDEETE